MRAFWKTSLTARLTVTLSCALVVFWLVSESVSFHYRYIKIQNDLRDDLTWEMGAIAQGENRRYDYAERQARTLLALWGTLRDRITPSLLSGSPGRRSVFVPFADANGNTDLVRRAREVVELYGNADLRSRGDTFLVLPNEGIILFQPDAMSSADMDHRVSALSSLRTLSRQPFVRWTETIRDSRGFVRSAVTVVDPETGVIAGQNLRVGDISPIPPDMALKTYPRFLLQSQSGETFWVGADAPAKAAPIGLPSICNRTHWIRRDDYFVICAPLGGPRLTLAAIYPVTVVSDRALSLLPLTTPWTLIAQLLLIVVVYVTLQRQLGRPLRHIVDTIDAQRKGDLGRRLSADRQDELGRIARAYNMLLGTVNAYYKTLENKVRERTRELAEAKRIAESANHRKSEHIASISHELRTPLNGIAGALTLLARSPLQPEQQELVRMAQQSSGYLLGIVNNVLDFSRIEAGQLELAPERTDLLPLLDQAMLTIHIRAQEKHLRLSTVVASNVPRRIVLDGLRVRQILINLLGNAAKFTDRGHIRLLVERRAQMLAFVVEDTGKGIPDEFQLDIFKPFVQVRAHDSGNGLGLAIASRLANLMNGEILLDSKLGEGTRFSVLLPLHAEEAPAPLLSGRIVAPAGLHEQLSIWGLEPEEGGNPLFAMPESCYLPGKLWAKVMLALRGELAEDEAAPAAICPWSLKILVVDDIQLNRDIVGKMLRELGQQVQTAASGLLALDLGRNQVFDLVLMDMRMPELDGMATASRWRSAEDEMLDPDTPIVALTANALPVERERARQAGMNGYLTKPVSLEQLADTINDVASTQLARGIELARNTVLNLHIIDLNDRAMRENVHRTLMEIYQQIESAWQHRDVVGLLDLLHALKGCAGQGGLDLVREAAEQQERRVRDGRWISRQDVSDLAALISIQFS
ncbi:hybrid sensor histidine kinase/response regulator [Burkholderia ubonensis]|nr:hybrid sensor histidine kinase/response regulator [Burkholderia ubonensis]